MTRTPWTAAALLVLACATPPKPSPSHKPTAAPTTSAADHRTAPAPAPTSDFTPPTLRLPDTTVPTAYRAELTLLPKVPRFTGAIDIDLRVLRPTRVVWLNANQLTISRAVVTQAGKTAAARVILAGQDFVGFDSGAALVPGSATIHLEYAGVIATNDSSGIFHEVEAKVDYLFSQFETVDARRAFPCFDEPNIKTPWTLKLHVSAKDTALANTPVVSETPEPGEMKAVTFATTRPIASYLVAFGVGPFDFVRGPPAGKNRVPVRVFFPRGHSHEADAAARQASELLTRLEGYFEIPYPYEKMDLLAIPNTYSFGAMENPGLVTFVETLILLKPGQASLSRIRSSVEVTAHEFAHQWFGDLVTTAWWDDVWLNESFATWMENKIVDAYRPAWQMSMERISQREQAMRTDSLVSARQIRQPILAKDDLVNAFDPISYQKGSSVIGMFENWLSPEVFRAGVRGYLNAHAFQATTAHDFLSALSEAAHKDVETPFSTFLDQPGLPLVSAALKCTAGAPPELVLRQRRYVPLGARGQAKKPWQLPVCTRFARDGKGEGTQCNLLTQLEQSFVLEGATGCPSWVYPDAGSHGYYRLLLSAELDAPLEKAPLTVEEKMGVLANARALMRSGDLPPERVLALAERAAKGAGDNPHLLRAALDLSDSVPRQFLSPEDARRNASYLSRLWAARTHAMGFRAHPGESEETRLLRPAILEAVAMNAQDAKTLAGAFKLADAWLKDGRGLGEDVRAEVFAITARFGTVSQVTALLHRLQTSEDQSVRRDLATGLRAVDSPEAFALLTDAVMKGTLTPLEDLELLLGDDVFTSGPARFDYIKGHFDDLARLLPRDGVSTLMRTGDWFCDLEHRAEVEAALAPRTAKTVGSPRILAQTLEVIDQCIAQKEKLGPGISKFLARAP